MFQTVDGDLSLKVYLDDIRQHKLIDRAEEVRLAKLIEQGDREARDKLLCANLRLDVRPVPPFDDVVDLLSSHAKHGAEVSGLISLFSPSSDFQDLLSCEFSLFMQLAAAGWWELEAVTPLGDHVMHVVGRCTKKEMIGPDAARVVTVVTDQHPFRDWPEVEFIGEAMGGPSLIPDTKCAVAVGGMTPCPLPTVNALCHVTPEAPFSLLAGPLVMTSWATEGDTRPPCLTSKSRELPAADRTGEYHWWESVLVRSRGGILRKHAEVSFPCVTPGGVTSTAQALKSPDFSTSVPKEQTLEVLYAHD